MVPPETAVKADGPYRTLGVGGALCAQRRHGGEHGWAASL